MSKQKSAWGIEIGASGIKAIKLVASEAGADIENYAVVPYKQVLSTPDVDANELVRLALQEFLSKHELEGSSVVASVSGATGVARFATLPPVEPKRIPEIVKFEAVQQIPFPIEQAEWDYQVFQQADMPDVKVGVFAIAKDRIIEYMANFDAAGVHLESLTLSPLAVFNAFTFDHKLGESRKCTAYVDIGTMATDVIIVEDNIPWVRTFPIGGHHLTEALVKQLKISYSRAEEEKLGLATSKMGKQMLQAMRGVVLDMAQEIGRSINYYQQLNRGSEVKRIVGVGGSFRLPGLVKFLSQNLPVEIERLEQFNRLEVSGRHGSRLVQHSIELSTAYGLALQGLGLARVEANLLPRQLLLGRLWKAKQWWFVGAAAGVLAAAAVAGGVWVSQKAAAEKVLADRTLSSLNEEAEKYQKDLAALKSDDPRAMSETLIRTQYYRDLYPTVLAEVSSAIESVEAPREFAADAPDLEKVKGLYAAGKGIRIRVRKVEFNYVPPKPRSGSIGLDPAATFGFTAAGSNPFVPNQNPAFIAERCAPPSINVVVHCSTDMDAGDAATLISRTIKPWFEKRKAQLDAAYAKWDDTRKKSDLDTPEGQASLLKACPERLYRLSIDSTDQLFVREAVGTGGRSEGGSVASLGFGLGGDSSLPPLSKLLPERPVIGSKPSFDFKMSWDMILAGPEVAGASLAARAQAQASPSATVSPATPNSK